MPDEAITEATGFVLDNMQVFGAFSLVLIALIVIAAILCLVIYYQRKDYRHTITELTSRIDAANEDRNLWQSRAYQDRRESAEAVQELAKETTASLQTIERVMDALRRGV